MRIEAGPKTSASAELPHEHTSQSPVPCSIRRPPGVVAACAPAAGSPTAAERFVAFTGQHLGHVRSSIMLQNDLSENGESDIASKAVGSSADVAKSGASHGSDARHFVSRLQDGSVAVFVPAGDATGLGTHVTVLLDISGSMQAYALETTPGLSDWQRTVSEDSLLGHALLELFEFLASMAIPCNIVCFSHKVFLLKFHGASEADISFVQLSDFSAKRISVQRPGPVAERDNFEEPSRTCDIDSLHTSLGRVIPQALVSVLVKQVLDKIGGATCMVDALNVGAHVHNATAAALHRRRSGSAGSEQMLAEGASEALPHSSMVLLTDGEEFYGSRGANRTDPQILARVAMARRVLHRVAVGCMGLGSARLSTVHSLAHAFDGIAAYAPAAQDIGTAMASLFQHLMCAPVPASVICEGPAFVDEELEVDELVQNEGQKDANKTLLAALQPVPTNAGDPPKQAIWLGTPRTGRIVHLRAMGMPALAAAQAVGVESTEAMGGGGGGGADGGDSIVLRLDVGQSSTMAPRDQSLGLVIVPLASIPPAGVNVQCHALANDMLTRVLLPSLRKLINEAPGSVDAAWMAQNHERAMEGVHAAKQYEGWMGLDGVKRLEAVTGLTELLVAAAQPAGDAVWRGAFITASQLLLSPLAPATPFAEQLVQRLRRLDLGRQREQALAQFGHEQEQMVEAASDGRMDFYVDVVGFDSSRLLGYPAAQIILSVRDIGRMQYANLCAAKNIRIGRRLEVDTAGLVSNESFQQLMTHGFNQRTRLGNDIVDRYEPDATGSMVHTVRWRGREYTGRTAERLRALASSSGDAVRITTMSAKGLVPILLDPKHAKVGVVREAISKELARLQLGGTTVYDLPELPLQVYSSVLGDVLGKATARSTETANSRDIQMFCDLYRTLGWLTRADPAPLDGVISAWFRGPTDPASFASIPAIGVLLTLHRNTTLATLEQLRAEFAQRIAKHMVGAAVNPLGNRPDAVMVAIAPTVWRAQAVFSMLHGLWLLRDRILAEVPPSEDIMTRLAALLSPARHYNADEFRAEAEAAAAAATPAPGAENNENDDSTAGGGGGGGVPAKAAAVAAKPSAGRGTYVTPAEAEAAQADVRMYGSTRLAPAVAELPAHKLRGSEVAAVVAAGGGDESPLEQAITRALVDLMAGQAPAVSSEQVSEWYTAFSVVVGKLQEKLERLRGAEATQVIPLPDLPDGMTMEEVNEAAPPASNNDSEASRTVRVAALELAEQLEGAEWPVLVSMWTDPVFGQAALEVCRALGMAHPEKLMSDARLRRAMQAAEGADGKTVLHMCQDTPHHHRMAAIREVDRRRRIAGLSEKQQRAWEALRETIAANRADIVRAGANILQHLHHSVYFRPRHHRPRSENYPYRPSSDQDCMRRRICNAVRNSVPVQNAWAQQLSAIGMNIRNLAVTAVLVGVLAEEGLLTFAEDPSVGDERHRFVGRFNLGRIHEAQ